MLGCGNPGGAASWEAGEGLAVKTCPGSCSVRVLECADVGERKREGADGGLRVGANAPGCSSIFVPLTP